MSRPDEDRPASRTQDPDNVPAIVTPRLTLVSLAPSFLAASLARDRAQAERLVGLRVPDEWFDEHPLIALRLDDLRADPGWRPWMLRAVGLMAGSRRIEGVAGLACTPSDECSA